MKVEHLTLRLAMVVIIYPLTCAHPGEISRIWLRHIDRFIDVWLYAKATRFFVAGDAHEFTCFTGAVSHRQT